MRLALALALLVAACAPPPAAPTWSPKPPVRGYCRDFWQPGIEDLRREDRELGRGLYTRS